VLTAADSGALICLKMTKSAGYRRALVQKALYKNHNKSEFFDPHFMRLAMIHIGRKQWQALI
jgi:hypothetical protein